MKTAIIMPLEENGKREYLVLLTNESIEKVRKCDPKTIYTAFKVEDVIIA